MPTNNEINRRIAEFMEICWHSHETMEQKHDHLPPPEGYFECACGAKSDWIPFDSPDYTSPDSPRRLLDEVVDKLDPSNGRLCANDLATAIYNVIQDPRPATERENLKRRSNG